MRKKEKEKEGQKTQPNFGSKLLALQSSMPKFGKSSQKNKSLKNVT
jgi:hypothetical protein